MSTAVSNVMDLLANRATCQACEDVVPVERSTTINHVRYCNPCAYGVMRYELKILSRELAS